MNSKPIPSDLADTAPLLHFEHVKSRQPSSETEQVESNPEIETGVDVTYSHEIHDDTINDINSFELPSIFCTTGMHLSKISHKSNKRILFWVDSINFKLIYKQVTRHSLREFLIDDIRAISSRESASHYREELGLSKEFEKRWISITYFDSNKGKLKSLHLVADTNHDLKKLLYVLQNFKTIKDKIFTSFLIDLKDLDEVRKGFLSGKAENVDKNQKELLRLPEVFKYCKRLNIGVSDTRLEKFFHDAKLPSQDGMNFLEFKTFVKLLTFRSELLTIWESLTNQSNLMDFESFREFLNEVQKETYGPELEEKIFKKFITRGLNHWTRENWVNFLCSKYCTFSKEKFLDANYFSRPLNEYYVLSSHNTYLIGRQVAGDSSIEGYVKALQRGCRCLEIDIWNNEDDNESEPIVNHGRTFSNGISLSNVLKTIKKYSFLASQYPLILSLEIHCSREAQSKVVSLLQNTFGSSLVLMPIDANRNLPSPEALKNKILLKIKKTSPFSSGIDEEGRSSTSTTGTSLSESNELPFSSRKNALKLRRKSTGQVLEVLSKLAVYCQGIKFRNFSLPESKTYNHCFSLSEKSANSMLKDTSKAESLDKHNRKFLMRVYPSKIRLKSSNFIPLRYWAHGVQMVATNWQTYDLGQQINESFFETVQNRGYVLKPLRLRKPVMKSTMRKVSSQKKLQVDYSISVISAQQLPRTLNCEPPNPFVTVELIGQTGMDMETVLRSSFSEVVAENGFNPVWDQEFAGKFTTDHEFVFLRLSVNTSTSSTSIESPRELGIAVMHFFDMKHGYRYCRLKDSCGEHLLHSSLFLKIAYDIL